MSEYNFKKFVKTGSKLGNYSISFNGKSFTFGFSSGFYYKNEIAKYKKVVMFYDDEKKAVAFQFTNEDKAEGAFTIVHGNNKTTGSVTAKSFILENKIDDPKYYGRKTPIEISDDSVGQLVVIQLLDGEQQIG